MHNYVTIGADENGLDEKGMAAMFEIAKMTPLRTLELPPAIAEQFGPSDRFIAWVEGDTVHLKRITASPLQGVENSPSDELLSLEEINDIVHEVRKQHQHKPE